MKTRAIFFPHASGISDVGVIEKLQVRESCTESIPQPRCERGAGLTFH